jgi:ribonuclease H2 subunit A
MPIKDSIVEHHTSHLDRDAIYTLGIDEAGRGPVLGPLVYAIFICQRDLEGDMRTLGVQDSKELTHESRLNVLERLKGVPGFGWCFRVISPQEISNSMLQKNVNLNELSYNAVYSLLDKVIKELLLKVDHVYVDTLGKPQKYEARLSSRYPNVKFTVSTKADSIFPIVGAASIVAKVTRDARLKEFPLPDGIDRDFGSGYPGDPLTVSWLDRNAHPVRGFPDIVRFSWISAEKMLEKKGFTCTFKKKKSPSFRGLMRLANLK